MNTRYQRYHWTGIYVPPGEVVTIEIPQKLLDDNIATSAYINRHCFDKTTWDTRT